MDLSSAPRGKMYSCTSPPSRRTATAPLTRVKPWSLICSRAPKASRRPTSSAPNPRTIPEPSQNPPDPSGRVFLLLGKNSEQARTESRPRLRRRIDDLFRQRAATAHTKLRLKSQRVRPIHSQLMSARDEIHFLESATRSGPVAPWEAQRTSSETTSPFMDPPGL